MNKLDCMQWYKSHKKIILSEKSQTQKSTVFMIPFTLN